MVSSTANTTYLIDASIYIFRAYFAMPDHWHSPQGRSVNALYGYARFILQFLQQSRAQSLAAAYDESLGSCFRNDIYADYKSSRALPDEELAYQLTACKAFTEMLGIYSPASERYEADDIIATLALAARQQGDALVIVTRDKDLSQLLHNAEDFLWDYAADKRFYRQDIFDQFAVFPEQIVDYLALVGDSVDDIPGVPGIGKKTAAALMRKFGTIDKLYSDLGAVAACGLRGASGIASRLESFRGQVNQAQQLVQLEYQVPVDRPAVLSWQAPEQQQLEAFLAEHGLLGALQKQLNNCYWWQE
jgi:5'-3' exonuclease